MLSSEQKRPLNASLDASLRETRSPSLCPRPPPPPRGTSCTDVGNGGERERSAGSTPRKDPGVHPEPSKFGTDLTLEKSGKSGKEKGKKREERRGGPSTVERGFGG